MSLGQNRALRSGATLFLVRIEALPLETLPIYNLINLRMPVLIVDGNATTTFVASFLVYVHFLISVIAQSFFLCECCLLMVILSSTVAASFLVYIHVLICLIAQSFFIRVLFVDGSATTTFVASFLVYVHFLICLIALGVRASAKHFFMRVLSVDGKATSTFVASSLVYIHFRIRFIALGAQGARLCKVVMWATVQEAQIGTKITFAQSSKKTGR